MNAQVYFDQVWFGFDGGDIYKTRLAAWLKTINVRSPAAFALMHHLNKTFYRQTLSHLTLYATSPCVSVVQNDCPSILMFPDIP